MNESLKNDVAVSEVNDRFFYFKNLLLYKSMYLVYLLQQL
jgi:hypothetical protein